VGAEQAFESRVTSSTLSKETMGNRGSRRKVGGEKLFQGHTRDGGRRQETQKQKKKKKKAETRNGKKNAKKKKD